MTSVTFPFVDSIVPYQGPTSTSPLAYKYYNKNEVIMGKPMREWLRFSVCFWHTFRGVGNDPFGSNTLNRPWTTQDSSHSDKTIVLEECKQRIEAAFEFFVKLGVDYYT